MRSPWNRGHAEDHHAPVEMRFIDMFMTALGSLVFLALLLVFLLPKTTQSNSKDEELKKLQQQIQQLEQRVPKQPSRQPGGANTEDKDIVKRGFGVLLVTGGCASDEPKLYVRWEGTMVDFNTEQPMHDPLQFDASTPTTITKLIGHQYFDLGDGVEGSSQTEPDTRLTEGTSIAIPLFKKAGTKLRLFTAVSRGPGSYSVYVGLNNPDLQSDGGCTVKPVYLSSSGSIPGDAVVMIKERPYAWLRRFKINGDGSTTLSTTPRQDEQFKLDLAEFSRTQSQSLCQKTPSLCPTMDAHYALLVPPAPPASSKLKWSANRYFSVFSYARKEGISPERCEKACVDEGRCVALEYSKVTLDCSLFDLAPKPLSNALGTTDIALKTSSETITVAPRPRSVLDGSFVTYDNYDLYGGDLRSLNVDRKTCASACEGDPSCKAYSYDKWKGYCYLKSTLVSLVLNPASLSGVRGSLGEPGTSELKIRMERSQARKFFGGDFLFTTKSTLESCEIKCQQDERCVGLTFEKGEDGCRLFKSIAGSAREKNATSAIKTQAPP
jgi:hypothetical protein